MMENTLRSASLSVKGNWGDSAEQDGPSGRTLSASGVTDAKATSLKPAGLKAPRSGTRKLILVLDDDPSMLNVIDRMLRMHGIDVKLFNSVKDFEARANLAEATCLVLDINLNGESGIDLRRRITMSGISIPAIFITANDSARVRQAAIEADCSAFLVKPFPMKSLIDAITKAVPEPGRPE